MLNGNTVLCGVAILAVLLLGGCAQGDIVASESGAATGSGTQAGPDADGPGCPELVSSVAISSDTEPTAVLGCTVRNEHVPGEGEWSVTVHERATGRAMLDLIAALRLPSEPLSNGMCTMEMRMPTVVRLETASGPVDVATPKSSCGQTLSEVTDPYQAQRWVEVSRVRDERLRAEAAVTAGCDRWKDMLAMLSAARATALQEVPGRCWRRAPRSRVLPPNSASGPGKSASAERSVGSGSGVPGAELSVGSG